MDEPTKGMDAEYKEELGSILKKLQSHGMTIFMISHDVEFVAEYADTTGLFFEGNVVTSKKTRDFFAGNNFYTTAGKPYGKRSVSRGSYRKGCGVMLDESQLDKFLDEFFGEEESASGAACLKNSEKQNPFHRKEVPSEELEEYTLPSDRRLSARWSARER